MPSVGCERGDRVGWRLLLFRQATQRQCDSPECFRIGARRSRSAGLEGASARALAVAAVYRLGESANDDAGAPLARSLSRNATTTPGASANGFWPVAVETKS